MTFLNPMVQASHVPWTGLNPSYLFPPLLSSAPVLTSAAAPLVSQPASATCTLSYLSARKKDCSSLSLENRNKSVQSQQHHGQVMGKATAVIFWWMTHFCQVQQHQQGHGSSAQDCLVGPSLQHPPAGGAQPAPAPARWDQEMASSSRSLGEGLPPGSKGRIVLMVPITHTPPTHTHKSHPHPILLYSMLMMLRFPTDPWLHITSTCSFLLFNAQTVEATDTGKISLYDCGASGSAQPMVQQFNLNTPDPCSNASSVYHPPPSRSGCPSTSNTLIFSTNHAKLPH